jgi:hypothetical protein
MVVKKMNGRTMVSATPTQKIVKRTAARRPRMRPTRRLKTRTVMVKRMKRPSGTPVSAIFIPRKVCISHQFR